MGRADRSGLGDTAQILRDDVAGLADGITKLFGGNTDAEAAKLRDRAQRIRDDVQVLFSEASSQGRELIDQSGVGKWQGYVEDTVRDRPLTMLALAAGVGMIIGSQWGSAYAGRKSGRRRSWTANW